MINRLTIAVVIGGSIIGGFLGGIAWEREKGSKVESIAEISSRTGSTNVIRVASGDIGTANEAPLSLNALLSNVDATDRRQSRDRLHDVLDRAPARQLAEIVEELGRLEAPTTEDRLVMRAVYQRWAELDPVGALAVVATIKDFETRRRVVHTAFEVLAGSDFEAAKQSLADLQSGELRRQAVEAIAEGRREADVGETLAWAESLSGRLRVRAVRDTVARWSETDPAAAVGYAQTLPPSESSSELLHDLIRDWARSEPTAAVDFARTLPRSERTRETMHQIARAWAAEDTEAAVGWANTLSDTETWRSSFDGIAEELAQVDPRRAAELAGSLEDRDMKHSVLETVANTWSRQSFEEASEWVRSLPPEDRLAASNGLLGSVAETDPSAAAALYDDLSAGLSSSEFGDELRHTAGEIAERWSAFDVARAATWSQTLPTENDVQRRAVETVADRWARTDSDQAERWVSELPHGGPRDAATERLVDHLSGTDPESALAWTMTVSEPEHQTDMLRHVFERWRENDPLAARDSFDRAAMAPEQREHLVEVFE